MRRTPTGASIVLTSSGAIAIKSESPQINSRTQSMRTLIFRLGRVRRTKYKDLAQARCDDAIFRSSKELYDTFVNGMPCEPLLFRNFTLVEKYYARKLAKRYDQTLNTYIESLEGMVRAKIEEMSAKYLGDDHARDETPCVWYLNADPEDLGVAHIVLYHHRTGALRENVQGKLVNLNKKLVVTPRWIYDIVARQVAEGLWPRAWTISTTGPRATDQGWDAANILYVGECVELQGADIDIVLTLFDQGDCASEGKLRDIVEASRFL